MSEAIEISAGPIMPSPETNTPQVSCPPSHYNSPSLSGPPLLDTEPPEEPKIKKNPRTPLASLTQRFITPLGSPVRKALRSTKFDPQDAWLPLTESKNGNKYYAAFHTLCSGIGVQVLVLPLAFAYLGWFWGIISLTAAFVWQLYTLWILIQLHECVETGTRYIRYLQLACDTFGNKSGKLLGFFPFIYLSGGTCVALVVIGGSALKTFFSIVCGVTCSAKVTNGEWCLIFTTAAVLLSQLPNLNSIAGVSLIGAITAIGYCTLIWVVSVAKGSLPGVSYDPATGNSWIDKVNALGIIAFAFRGHNLILEIQGTMPSTEKHPSHVPMWKGVKVAYTLIAMCLFPLAIGGYWAYGRKIPSDKDMLAALYMFHSHDVSRFVLGLTSLFVVINSVSSFQIYGLPAFDDFESFYTRKKNKQCPWWLRALILTLFGYFNFFAAVAAPVVATVAGMVGGMVLPVTLVYPCFMWLKIKKVNKYSAMRWLNWGLGLSGMCLSALVVAVAFRNQIKAGVKFSFFDHQ